MLNRGLTIAALNQFSV